MSQIIDKLTLPSGLRSLSISELQTVCKELREELISSVSTSGGHFASSLGATEITVALHHAFNTPDDRLIWDVGHQAYIHKMLTGRREEMHSIRKLNGLSGFLKRSESEYDAFGAGHAGTSISAAVGMSLAFQRNHPERYVVPVIGDGSLTAGMAFEALNHAGDLGLKNFIVILNDNEMSISPNVGAISWMFSRAVTSQTYTAARHQFKELYKKGYVPKVVYRAIDKAEEVTQGFFATPAMLFEAFGFRYIGPIDGHNVEELVGAIERAKRQDVPVIIHCATLKGKGYEPAEHDPIKWHGVTPFDKQKAEFIAPKLSATKLPPSYTNVFADTLIDLAKKDKNILGITAAMPGGTGLDKLAKEVPSAFMDVGICEQHAVTCAAGLACEGFRPVVAIYSTFLQRAYDQVIHDVCIQNLPVVFAMDRGGVVGNDGETHQGVFDIAFLRTIPNMLLMSPKDEAELKNMLYTAVEHNGPIALRYPRGNGTGVEISKDYQKLEIGKAEVISEGSDVLLIAFGPIIEQAKKAAQKITKELGLSCTIVNARFAKPLDEDLLCELLGKHAICATVEDGALQGGFGSAVLEMINSRDMKLQNKLLCFGVKDEFVVHGSQGEQYQMNGYDGEGIFNSVAHMFENSQISRENSKIKLSVA